MTEVQGVCDKRFGSVRDALAASLDRAFEIVMAAYDGLAA
jgi:hypothetical protein